MKTMEGSKWLMARCIPPGSSSPRMFIGRRILRRLRLAVSRHGFFFAEREITLERKNKGESINEAVRGMHVGDIAGPRAVLSSFARRHRGRVLPRPVRRKRPVS